MGSFYRHCLRPLLFLQDSEVIHNRVLRGLSLSARLPGLPLLADACYGASDLPVALAGLKFPNPIGLAAGMDKAAAAVPMWERLGFGFAELGGVTRHAQTGNDTPRMFRAVADRALVNRMGFNNPGAEAMAEALRGWRKREQWPMHPIGINLGKSKVTPLKEAADDYAFSFRTLQGLADFFVVNVSSPNTPNLRELQDKNALDEILKTLRAVNAAVPLFIKIAPDLSTEAIDDVLDLTEGDEEISRDPVDLEHIAGAAAETLAPIAAERGVVLALDVHGSAGTVRGDPRRIRQAVEHLLRFSINGLGPGGRLLLHVDGDADSARIIVSDDGPGMSQEAANHAFDRFASSASVGPGSDPALGLGLPLAKRFVEAHGGTVMMLSQPGEGMLMTIGLPRG